MLLRVQDIPVTREDAVRSRLRSLQRLGLTAGARRGQGKRATYNAADLVFMGLALELSQLGLTPERTISLLQTQSGAILTAIREAVGKHSRKGFPCHQGAEAVYLAFDPTALRDGSIFFHFLRLDALFTWLKEDTSFTHMCIVNLSGTINKIYNWLADVAVYTPHPVILSRPRLFLEELRSLADEMVTSSDTDDE